MTTMRAAVLQELGKPFSIERVELFDPSPTQVVVRVTALPFCSTDHKSAHGELDKVPPTVLGHTVVGYVEDVGSAVTHVKPGDRVVVPGTPECGECYYCLRGRPDQCSELMDQTGGYPPVGRLLDGRSFTAAGNVGGYAEKVLVSKNQVWPLNSDLPDDQLSLLGCGITAGLGAVFNAAKVEAGSSVAIVGAGHLGLWMAQGARLAGAAQIIVVDPHEHRRAAALGLGATAVIDPAQGDAVEQVRALTGGRGADYALEAAGPELALESAFAMSRRAGTVVFTGFHRIGTNISLPSGAVALHGRTIMSVQNGKVLMGRDIPIFVDWMERGLVDAKPLISNHYTLEGINEAMAASRDYSDLSGIIYPQT
jgi:S-(hydroxymethyl)glutathione dehydrogenase/alcohol dehydrogenase